MICEHDWVEFEDHCDLGGHPRHPDATHACTKCGADGIEWSGIHTDTTVEGYTPIVEEME